MTSASDAEGSDGSDSSDGEDSVHDSRVHVAHLSRSERVWDRWSDRYGPSERDLEPIRERAMAELDVGPGDRVLDVGCGPGVEFERLRELVGPGGEVVGVDYSPAMVERASDRVDEHGWSNVRVERADATTADLGDGFDAAVATLSLSVLPDVRRGVANVREALRPGGALAVFDLRPVPAGPARLLNPALRRCLHWIANWNPDGDVVAALGDEFDACEVVETYAGGVGFVAVASTSGPERRHEV